MNASLKQTVQGFALLSALCCQGATNMVSNTSDSGLGSLRQAILNANATPEADRIEFSIRASPLVVPRIRLTSPLPTISRSLDIDGTTQAAGHVELDGSQAGPNADGLRVSANGCDIRGLVINRFSGDGIEIIGPGRDNWIRQNFIGTDTLGLADLGNGGHGVFINNSPGNSVGANPARGTLVLSGTNVIAGNGGSGVFISGSQATDNNVSQNHIGVSVAGTVAIPNVANGVTITNGAVENFVGALGSTTRNVISGNGGYGVEISSIGAPVVLIRTSVDVPKVIAPAGQASSTLPINDRFTILDLDVRAHVTHNPIRYEALTLIGPDGLTLKFQQSFGPVSGQEYLNTIWDDEGQFIGSGTPPYSGRYFPAGPLRWFDYLSTEGDWRLRVQNGDADTFATLHSWSLLITTIRGNRVAGNHIGVNATGQAALGNGAGGIWLNGSPGNRIGGATPVDRNVISGNSGNGVAIFQSSAIGNVIAGNFIGVAADGQTRRANLGHGVSILGADQNMIGGTADGAANVISGNGSAGIILLTQAHTNQILGNRIGVAADGTTALGNGADGIRIDGSIGNRVGDIRGNAAFMPAPFGPNTIAHNGGAGVLVTEVTGHSRNNRIRGNSIYSNEGLGLDLSRTWPADGVTPNGRVDDFFDAGPNGLQPMPELEPYYAGNYPVNGRTRGDGSRDPDEYIDVDFYTNPTADPSGHGEGQTYLGGLRLNVQANGVFDFNGSYYDPYLLFTTTSGQYLTATATDQDGNTSEFSLATEILQSSGLAVDWRSSAASIFGGAVELNKPFTYTTRVSNFGPDTAENVRLTNDLPDSVELVSFHITQGACQQIGDLVICDLGSMLVGSNNAVFLTLEVIPRETGFLTNHAIVAASTLPGETRSSSPGSGFSWAGPAPKISFAISGPNLILSVPTNPFPGSLQMSDHTNSSPIFVWGPSFIPYQLASTNRQYTVPMTATNRFFRMAISSVQP